MSAKTKQTMRFCTRHRGKSPIACLLEPCKNPCMVVHTTNSLPDRDKGSKTQEAHAVRATLSLSLHKSLSIRRLNTSAPQTVTALSALQALRKCSVHNCAFSASLRECSAHPSRTTTFTSKGLIPDHCVTKEQQLHWRMREPSMTPTMSHESQIGSENQQRKPGRNSACTAL